MSGPFPLFLYMREKNRRANLSSENI
jgi:hypothetical protein